MTSKKLFFIALAGALAICCSACKLTSTKSTTTLFNPDGSVLAEHQEKTKTGGVFVNSATANPQGIISYTNKITSTNGFSFVVSESKDFKAGAANYKTDAAGIKATGGAIGEAAGSIVNPAPKPGN